MHALCSFLSENLGLQANALFFFGVCVCVACLKNMDFYIYVQIYLT